MPLEAHRSRLAGTYSLHCQRCDQFLIDEDAKPGDLCACEEVRTQFNWGDVVLLPVPWGAPMVVTLELGEAVAVMLEWDTGMVHDVAQNMETAETMALEGYVAIPIGKAGRVVHSDRFDRWVAEYMDCWMLDQPAVRPGSVAERVSNWDLTVEEFPDESVILTLESAGGLVGEAISVSGESLHVAMILLADQFPIAGKVAR